MWVGRASWRASRTSTRGHENDAEGQRRGNRRRELTALAVAYFFSVVMAEPLLLAALRALWPRSTVSRGPPAPPRVLLPILVTEFQSSDILAAVVVVGRGNGGGDRCVWWLID